MWFVEVVFGDGLMRSEGLGLRMRGFRSWDREEGGRVLVERGSKYR